MATALLTVLLAVSYMASLEVPDSRFKDADGDLVADMPRIPKIKSIRRS
jgi:hypothetical protein